MEKNYKEKLVDITTFCFDVDGVFTDGIVYLTNSGEQMRTAYVRDGYAVQLAIKKGLRIVIITGGNQEGVRKRFEGLGVKDIHLGCANKVDTFDEMVAKYGLQKSEICYMGDDIPDYHVMQMSGLPCCPSDSAPEIKKISSYISPAEGGRGCVRDILEQAMKVKGMWMNDNAQIW
jgi:3-deoxy-D-manno-octulosonate 8-phosphate phosphatase (KDO 8-P phosphatase)